MDSPVTPNLESPSPLPNSPLTAPPPPPSRARGFILGSLGIALGCLLSLFRAWAWSYGTVNAEMLGYAAGGALFPALIAYAIAGRKSVRNFNRFGIWFSGICVFVFIFTPGKPVSMQEHIKDLMKEAAGTKSKDFGGPTIDVLVRELMQGVLQDRKTFEQETAVFTPELQKLHSSETFASREAMQRSIDATRGIVAADERYSQTLNFIPDRMQTRVDSSGLSDSDKRDFMAGIRQSFGNVKALQIRQQAVEVEKKWGDATVALYEFAMANETKFHVDHAKLMFSDEPARVKFNDQIKSATKLRSNLADLNAQLTTEQARSLQQMGLTKKDLAIENDTSPTKK